MPIQVCRSWLLVLIASAATLFFATRAYSDLEVPVKRRLLVPDFVLGQNPGVRSPLPAQLAARLRDEIEKTEKFSIIDQKLLSELRPKFKVDALTIEEWGKLGEELNCENTVLGFLVINGKQVQLRLEVIDSVTKESVALAQAAGGLARKDLQPVEQAVKAFAATLVEKLPTLDQGEVWREVSLEMKLVKWEEEKYRPILLARQEKQKQERIKNDKLLKKRFEEERKKQLAKLEKERKQRLKELEEEKKRIAEYRAQNPEAAANAGVLGAELARVGIFEFTDQTGSSNYQYLSSSLAGGIDQAMKDRFNFVPVDAATLEKIKTQSFNAGWLADADPETIATQAKADILISGTYSIPPGSNELKIKTVIYIQSTGELLGLPDFSNAIDGTLFEATEILSAKIVRRIMDIARSQMGAQNADPGAKVSLTRTVDAGWSTKNLEIAMVNSIGKASASDLGLITAAGVAMRYSPAKTPHLRLGVSAGILGFAYTATSTNSFYNPASARFEYYSDSYRETYFAVLAGGILGYQVGLSPQVKFFADFEPRLAMRQKTKGTTGVLLGAKTGFAFLLASHFALEIFSDFSFISDWSSVAVGGGMAVVFPF